MRQFHFCALTTPAAGVAIHADGLWVFDGELNLMEIRQHVADELTKQGKESAANMVTILSLTRVD